MVPNISLEPCPTSGDGIHEWYPRNDTERALRFVDHFGGDLRYVEAWDQWLVWNGTRWVRDSQGAVFRKAQQMSNILLQSATTIEDYEQRKKAADAAIAAGNESQIKAMLNVARYDARIEASPELFDSNPHLIGVTNGVVDLRTGMFRSAAKEDYITKQLGVAYDPKATGLGTPKVVLDATAEYREEEDELGEFISETCLLKGRIERKVLYDAFKAWVINRGIKFPMTQKAFAKRLRARGVQDGGKDGTGKRYWRGIALRPEVELKAEHRLIHHIIPSLP